MVREAEAPRGHWGLSGVTAPPPAFLGRSPACKAPLSHAAVPASPGPRQVGLQHEAGGQGPQARERTGFRVTRVPLGQQERPPAHPCTLLPAAPLTGQQEPRGSEGPHISGFNCPPWSEAPASACLPPPCHGYMGTRE